MHTDPFVLRSLRNQNAILVDGLGQIAGLVGDLREACDRGDEHATASIIGILERRISALQGERGKILELRPVRAAVPLSPWGDA